MTGPVITIKRPHKKSQSGHTETKLEVNAIPEFLQTDFMAFIEEAKKQYTQRTFHDNIVALKKLFSLLEPHQINTIEKLVSDETHKFLLGCEVKSKPVFRQMINAFRYHLLKTHHQALDIHAVYASSRGDKDPKAWFLTWVPEWIKTDVIEVIDNTNDIENGLYQHRRLSALHWIFKEAHEHHIKKKEDLFSKAFEKFITKEGSMAQINSYNILKSHCRTSSSSFVLCFKFSYRNIIYDATEIFQEVSDTFKEDYYHYCKAQVSEDLSANRSLVSFISQTKTYWLHTSKKGCKTHQDLFDALVSMDKRNFTLINQYLSHKLNIDVKKEFRKLQKKQNDHYVIEYPDGKTVFVNLKNVSDAWKKQYITHMKALTKTASPATLNGTVSHLNIWFEFLKTIGTPAINDMNYDTIHAYMVYLKAKYKNKQTIRLTKDALKTFITTLYHRKQINNIQFLEELGKSQGQDPLIESLPESVMKQIGIALMKEEDVYIRTYIGVAYYLGLRAGEILSLDADCLKPMNEFEIEGETWELHYRIEKNDNLHRVRTLIPKPLVKALEDLKVHTQALREASYNSKLFLRYHDKKVSVTSQSLWNNRLIKFVNTHQVVDSEGNLIALRPKDLRTTFISRMVAAGVTPYTLSEMFHENIETTLKYYDKVNSEEYTSLMSEAVEKIHIVTGFDDLKTGFTIEVDDENYWRVGSGYCTSAKAVANKNQMCPHIRNWGNCFTCPSYVTTPEHIPALQRYVDEWEDEIELLLERERTEESLKHLYARKDIVSLLIERLKELKDLQEEVVS